MANILNIGDFIDWIFNSMLGGQVLGNAGLLFLLVIAVFLILLLIMGSGQFFFIGFMVILFMGLVTYSFAYVGWIAGVALMIAGILVGLIWLRILAR